MTMSEAGISPLFLCLFLLSCACPHLRADEPFSRPDHVISLRSGLRHLDGVRSRVHSVAFDPGGDTLVSASARRIKFWSLARGLELRGFAELDGWMSRVVLTPDGGAFFSGGFSKAGGGFVRLRSASDGRVLAETRTAQAVSSLALSADGKVLAAGFSERSGAAQGDPAGAATQVALWSTTAGVLEPTGQLRGKRPGVSGVAVSADGRLVAWAAHHEGAVRVASVETGAVVHTLDQGLEGVTGIAFDAASKELAIGSLDGFVEIHGLEKGERRLRIRWPTSRLEEPLGVPVRSVAFSSDGTLLAASSCENNRDAPAAALWSAATGDLIREYPGGPEEGHVVVFSPDGRHLACGQGDGGIRVWETRSGDEALAGTRHRDRILGCALSPDGERLASSGRDGRVNMWASASGDVVMDHSLPRGQAARALAFSPDGRSLACLVAERDGDASAPTAVHLLDAEGKLLRKLDAMPGAWSLAWSAGGRLAVATGSQHESTGTLRVVDPRTGEVLEEASAWSTGIMALAWAPDGKQLALGTMDRVVALRRTGGAVESFDRHREDATPLRLLGALPCAVRALAWSRDGATVASASFRSIRLWEPATNGVRLLSAVHRHRLSGLAYDARGRRLASSDMEGRVVVWDAASGAAVDSWDLGGAVKVLGWRADAVAAVDAAGRAFFLDARERERGPPEPLAEAAGDKLTQGRLSAWVVARSTGWARPFRNLIEVIQDSDDSFLVTDISTGLWRVSPQGDVEMLASGGAITALRDSVTSEVLVGTRNTLSWLSNDGRVRSFMRGGEYAGTEHLLPDPQGDGWFLANRESARVHHLSRRGRMTTFAASPLLNEAGDCLMDCYSAEMIITAYRQVLRITKEREVTPLMRKHLGNPLELPDGLVQDPGSAEFFLVEEMRSPAIYRLNRQGLLAPLSSLLSRPIGLAQERDTGDLVISRNNNFGRKSEGGTEQSSILRFSGFTRACDFEVEGWLGAAADDVVR
jgi:WD40 repeat protein